MANNKKADSSQLLDLTVNLFLNRTIRNKVITFMIKMVAWSIRKIVFKSNLRF